MKKLILLIPLISSFCSFGQKIKDTVSLSRDIRMNFSYDSLSGLSCLNTPPGIYMVKFRVDEKGAFSEFKPNNDSLTDLNRLFIDAILKCSKTPGAVKLKKGIYLQSIYFNNVLYCHPFRDKNNKLQDIKPDSSVTFDHTKQSDIASIVNSQLVSIEHSIAGLDFQKFTEENMTWLPIVLINNEDPNVYRGPGFRNDMRQKDITSAEIETIQKLIEEKRRAKTGN